MCDATILVSSCPSPPDVSSMQEDSHCCVGLVVHEEEFEVAGVVDEEGLVARGHHVARLLVVAVADLWGGHEMLV